ncbi:MAG: hypothetical protein SCK70_15805, partial [bacterium]|nr:hypothetical protein [bacterium]
MVRYRFEYYLTRMVGQIARGLSIPTAGVIGDRLGDLFFHFIKIRRDVMLENLTHALGPERSPEELNRIALLNYRHFGRTLLEFARISQIKREILISEIPIINRNILDHAINQKRGVLVLSGHLGNWEYLAAAVASVGPPLYAIFKEQKNLLVDNLIKQQRINLGLLPLKVKGGAARGTLAALKQGAKVLILFDQDAGSKGVFIDFFDRPASTTDGPARIAIKYNIPCVMAFGLRSKRGAIRVVIEKFPDPAGFENNERGIQKFIETYN